MEWMKDFGLVAIRIVTIFPLLLFAALFMGRRSIGEMPVFDFLIVLALGAVVGADIADPKIEHLPTAFAILVIALVQKLFSALVLRSRWFGKLVTFEPIVIVSKGKLVPRNLKKAKYSIDNILHMLRENRVFDISRVELAVIEPSGNLSVLEKATTSLTGKISYPLIKEGRIEMNILPELSLKESWVHGMLREKSLRIEDVFLATIDEDLRVHYTLYKESQNEAVPPIHH